MKLIIAEKPSVAKDIAKVLNVSNKENGYYHNTKYFVTYAFGHLISLAPMEQYKETITLEDLPIIPDEFKLQVTDDPGIKKQLKIIKTLALKSSKIICATDAGREGELIFRYIYNYLQLKQPIDRLWISSLTKQAIEEGFNNLKDGKQYYNLYLAAKARSEADWLIGLNSSYALTKAYNKNLLLPLGRVQTPTLGLIVKRTSAYTNFKPVDYFIIQLKITKGNVFYTLNYNHNFSAKMDATLFLEELSNEVKVTDVNSKEKNEGTPSLFDLTSLQMEANSVLGFSAKKTLDLIQALYEKHKALTYPRTDSKFLSNDMKNTVLNTIKQITDDAIYSEIKTISNLKPYNDNKVTDHHAIIPTGVENFDAFSKDEKNIYTIVKNRFLAAFYKPCIKQITTIKFASNDKEPFILKGTVIKDIGWRLFYQKKVNDKKTEEKENLLPPFNINENYIIANKNVLSKKTTPPPLLNDSSLLKLMETAGKEIEDEHLMETLKGKGIGTPATRAAIIENLLKRNYIVRNKKHLLPTALGVEIIKALFLEKTEIVSSKLTGEWESKLIQIEKGELLYTDFMTELKSFTENLIQKVKNSSKHLTFNPDENLITCPKCKKGKIKESKKSFYCTKYNDDTLKCSFNIWKSIAGKKLTYNNVKNLIDNGKTKKLSGFKNKEGKSFSAVISLDNDFKTNFVYENKKRKNKK